MRSWPPSTAPRSSSAVAADAARRYLDADGRDAASDRPQRADLGCANLAHGFAACAAEDKTRSARRAPRPTSRIVTAYNDMLSAHQPYEPLSRADQATPRARSARRPRSRAACRRCATASPRASAGMELSLFSRDVIALSHRRSRCRHDMFDGALLLGICDKIVPGLLIGALRFGHLPAIFVPGRADAVGPRQQGEGAGPPALRRGQGRPRRRCSRPRPVLSRRRAPAPSTAPPTPTRC